MRKSVALITINPTLDIFLEGEDFSFSQKIFAKHSCIAAGGSAVNVARGLQRLGRSFKLYIIIGGEIGTLLKAQLVKEGIPFYFSDNKEETRVTTILMDGNKIKMFVSNSPKIDPTVLRKFIHDHYSEIASHKIILIAGSVPEESSNFIISDLLRPLINHEAKLIVDSRGSFAQKAYKEVPYVIKYNKEVDSNTHKVATKFNHCIHIICDLHKRGTSLVMHNTDKYCYAIYDGHIWRYPNYTKFKKRVFGRGDAFLAGLITALLDEYSFDKAIRFAIACGASFTCNFPLGEISTKLIPNYLRNIRYDVKRRIR